MHRCGIFVGIAVVLSGAGVAWAQDEPVAPPPTVSAEAAGAEVEAKTDAADKVEGSERIEGWNPGIAIGASFNLIDTRQVVGQQDGTTITIGGGFDAALEFNTGMHEWRNTLIASAGVSRTPAIDEFIKTIDGLAFESIYLLHVIEIFGPFARFGVNAQMFPANDIRPSPVDYVVANLDGSTSNFTGRRLELTDPFQPTTLEESLGVFVQPIRIPEIQAELRAGLGARETFAEGAIAITDDDATDPVEATVLDDSYMVGGEAVANAWGFLDPGKRISYTLGAGVLFPFVTSDLPPGDDRNLVDLITFQGLAGVNVKLFDWAALSYRLVVNRQPLVVDEWQISNNLLVTIGAAFGSKAPVPEEPACDCEEEIEAARKAAAEAEAAEAEAEALPDPAPVEAPAPAPVEPAAPPPPPPADAPPEEAPEEETP